MRIVQINTVCGTGSTGKIVADLYSLSKEAGFDAYIAYGRNTASADINSYKIGNTIDFVFHVMKNFFEGKSGFGSKYVTKLFLKWLDIVNPDIIHLHNIHGFYINVELLFEYIKTHNIPIVWTLHDCWSITGQCAFFDAVECSKWVTGCFNCPIFRSEYPYSLFKDNSRSNYIQKKNTFTGVQNMTLVTPSDWLARLVKKSFMSSYTVRVIPNGINLNTFSPANKSQINSSKIILGVANVWSTRKGLSYFLKLANMIDSSYHIVLIGVNQSQKKMIEKEYSQKITALTRTANQLQLADWYRRAFVYVNPTLEDNFPTTNLEALACGTPVITFNTGGSPESLTSDCGIVVKKGEINALLNAILSLNTHTEITSQACRDRALLYDKDCCFKSYIELYRDILSEKELQH